MTPIKQRPVRSLLNPHLKCGKCIIPVRTVEIGRMERMALREACTHDEDGVRPYAVYEVAATSTLYALAEVVDESTGLPSVVKTPLTVADALERVNAVATARGLNDDDRDALVAGVFGTRHGNPSDPLTGYPVAFKFIATQPGSILLVLDWQKFAPANPQLYRILIEIRDTLEATGAHVVLIAPAWTSEELPAELREDVTILKMPLPTASELSEVLDDVLDAIDLQLTPEQHTAVCLEAVGLTEVMAKDVFAMAVLECGLKWAPQMPRMVSQSKIDRIEETKLLRFISSNGDRVGGLGRYQKWVLQHCVPAFGSEDSVKGLLLLGVPGCGKSLSAKVLGDLLGTQVMLCSLATMEDKFVGGSADKMTRMLDIVTAMGRGVLLIDEIEKALAGHATSGQTGSTTSTILGILLTWMQDLKPDGILVVASANQYASLPPELARRFTAKFFVDLPSRSERIEIAKIHLAKRNGPTSDDICQHVADLTDKWVGSEIEELIIAASRITRRNVTIDSLTEAAQDIKPMWITNQAQIMEIREKCKDVFICANSVDEVAPSESTAPNKKRRISA